MYKKRNGIFFIVALSLLPIVNLHAFSFDQRMVMQLCKSKVDAINCKNCKPDLRSHIKVEVNETSSLVSLSEYVDKELIKTQILKDCKVISKNNWECRRIEFDHVDIWGIHKNLDTSYSYADKVLRISEYWIINRAYHGESSRGILHDGNTHSCAKKSIF